MWRAPGVHRSVDVLFGVNLALPSICNISRYYYKHLHLDLHAKDRACIIPDLPQLPRYFLRLNKWVRSDTSGEIRQSVEDCRLAKSIVR